MRSWEPIKAMTMPIAQHLSDDREYWQKRAEEARVLAEQYSDEMAKAAMFKVAEDCDKLAGMAAHYMRRTEQS
jgi:hypothetical protein